MLKQIGRQSQHHSVLPQQIQLLKLFHLTELDLQHRIQVELSDNPMLEAEIQDEGTTAIEAVEGRQDADDTTDDDLPDYNLEHNNYLPPDRTQRPFAEAYDFRKALKQQLSVHLTSDKEAAIAEFLVDSLNEDGFLDREVSMLADEISFQQQVIVESTEVNRVLGILLHLSPRGMGSRTMKDFLLFQLNARPPSPLVATSLALLTKHFHDLSYHQMEKIALGLDITESAVREAIAFIGTLPMKPFFHSQSSTPAARIIPDFLIAELDGSLSISLFHQRSSVVFVNQTLGHLLEKQNKSDKATLTYLKSKLNSAQWFVDAIKQRETTLLSIMHALVKFQAAYFREGDVRQLVPMILKDIADIVGMDISTVSRITCNKYAETPFGIIPLKSLFSEGVANERGASISNRVIRQAIREVVDGEDRSAPYTDKQLVSILNTKGFSIARRTVSKYRQRLAIPPAQHRVAW